MDITRINNTRSPDERNARNSDSDDKSKLPGTSDLNVECSSENARCSSPVYRQNQRARTLSSKETYRAKKSNTLLFEALQRDDVEQVAILLQTIASPDVTYRESHVTACHVAALSDSDALSLLLKAGADGQRTDCFGRRPLHLAAWAGHARQVAVLLNFPLDLQSKVDDIMSPETEEEVKSLRKMTNELINMRCEPMEKELADVKERNYRALEQVPVFQRGWTALHAACAGARARCARLLLAAGADARAPDAAGWTPLDVVGCSHYAGHAVNVDDFSEVIRLLLNAGAEFGDIRTIMIIRPFDKQGSSELMYNTPLHTAVELRSLEAIKLLLDAGAQLEYFNEAGQTPLHVCVKEQLKEHLELLISYKYECVEPKVAVDIMDVNGLTVLHSAIKDGWLAGVQVALDAGASVTLRDNSKESPIHTAARRGDADILEEIIFSSNKILDVDCKINGEKTALFIAIENNNIDCIRLLLSNGASTKHVLTGNYNVLHIAARLGNTDAINLLINHNHDEVKNMINAVTECECFSPICFAIFYNHFACVKLLLSKNASLSLNHNGLTTPLHVAASMYRYDIAKMIIEFDKETIHKPNSKGQLPLHLAGINGNRDIIALLIRNGADLSFGDHKDIRAIDLIMNNIYKPTEFLEEIFDSYISSDSVNLQDKNYSILMANNDDAKQMRVIKSLVKTGNRQGQGRLLLHPLIESFLYIKWKALVPFVYMVLFSFTCFVIALNIYVGSVFYYEDKEKKRPLHWDPNIWKYVVFVTVFIIAAQEIIYIRLKHKRYLVSFECWVKVGTIILASFLPLVVRWESGLNPEWARLIATVALLLSWLEMMFLLSRFPNWGFYVIMFGKVAVKVVKILFTFCFLLIGFALSFMIQFRSQPPFEGPFSAFMTTVVMMTSEFEYTDHFARSKAADLNASIIILRLVFLAFLILSSIVLMNLMVGVAVNDLNNLEVIGNIRRLETQVEFLTFLEALACHKIFSRILPKSWNKYIVVQGIRKMVLRMREGKRRYTRAIPSHIRETIFMKVQLQKKQMAETHGTATLKERLDQIYEAISKKEESDNVVNIKLLQDIMVQMNKKMDKIESGIDSMLLTQKRKSCFKHARSSGVML